LSKIRQARQVAQANPVRKTTNQLKNLETRNASDVKNQKNCRGRESGWVIGRLWWRQ
jgi:hypothetical protein